MADRLFINRPSIRQVLVGRGSGVQKPVEWTDVLNKPTLFDPDEHGHLVTEISGLAEVATTGSYTDLLNKPTIPSIPPIPSAPGDVGAEPVGTVATHNADTTGVHGIVDTALLETQAGAQSKATAAQSAAVSTAQGYTDTAVSGEAAARTQAISDALQAFIGIAPADLDQWSEVVAAIQSDQSGIAGIITTLGTKQDASATLGAISALATTVFGRSLLVLADAAAGRNALGLGTAATQAIGAFDAAGTAAVVQGNLNTHSADLANPHQVTKTQVGLSQVPNVDARARGTHTGTQDAATVDETATRKWMSATERTKVAGLITPAAGTWWGPGTGALGTIAAFGTGNVYTWPVIIPFDLKIDLVMLEVPTAAGTGGSTVRLAACRSRSDALPDFTTLFEIGVGQDSTTTGLKTFTDGGAHTLTAGVWWLALKCDTSGCSIRTLAAPSPVGMPYPAGFTPTANTILSMLSVGTAGGFVTTGTATAGANFAQPRVHFKIAA